MKKFNLVREIRELKNQLSYSKKYGFFFGAGTSCALGVPNIATLTTEVENGLEVDSKANFIKTKEDLETTYPDKTINIEDILNHLRQIRSITGGKKDKKYIDISGETAKKLDSEICKKIYTIISEKESKADLSSTKKFFAWLNMQNKNYSTELFTSNYDLIIEKSLEAIKAPYFDGFVGSYEPFFWQESIERFVDKSDLTQNWLRLWKIHGSLNWFWKENGKADSHSIFRGGKIPNIENVKNELVIYPSKEKYDSSKKQPFVAYFDRLKSVLTAGELLFVFSGYSFSDQHINEIIFNSLRQNNRLSVLVFFYQDSEVVELYKASSSYLNLTAFGPTKSIVNGTMGEWEYNESDLKPNEKSNTYWDKTEKILTLGDYNNLVEFFITNSGRKKTIEDVANG
ncbi:SIR2 family protein [Desulfoluna butyratoxydans]|uniref:Sir2-like domain n=1 Tax=Desulfoluna butyratoxydans TaxID=231438 RepID=A0A4U8YTX6_9BACT|nr:SIR2 family protein [Desulfoluna butyratoxydans]VFQ47440.1 sir2-like domain [Desulfoluna butyratoxydans]